MVTDEPGALPLPVPADVAEVLRRAADAVARGRAAVVVTVLTRRGSAPATPGQKLVLVDDGTCAGTIGGGALEHAVLRELPAALADARRGHCAPRTRSFHLGPELAMCCGGGVEVLVEPVAPAPAVGIVGGGHVCTALVPLLVSLGFVVTVADDREAWAVPARLPGATVLCDAHRALGARVPREGALLVMTHDHRLDQDAIEWALREGYAFVGGVGSRAKCARTRARLEAKDFPSDAIARVRMPLGLHIGARLPAEIALAIAAELVAWRRGVALAPEALAPGLATVSKPAP